MYASPNPREPASHHVGGGLRRSQLEYEGRLAVPVATFAAVPQPEPEREFGPVLADLAQKAVDGVDHVPSQTLRCDSPHGCREKRCRQQNSAVSPKAEEAKM